ncbi:hypothetical protein P3T23_006195 [Paraburkholderia sp. GAS448]|uniref:hypothetical protein n=1 Tax=Paraburkholderia sp. GAS448 TaxID=3035136 RepID=UPI003D1E3252
MLDHIAPAVLVAVLRASSAPLFSAWMARASSYEPWVEVTRAQHHGEMAGERKTGVGEVRNV